ncbi:MAG: aminodeoxychorismate synthase component I [bacterium]|nr:aminodeoxychorismate synthase component I [bacterium]
MNWQFEKGSSFVKTKTIIDNYNGLLFHHPQTILESHNPENVIEILQQVEWYQQKGYYCVGLLAYEAAIAFNKRMRVKPKGVVPLIWFAVYENFQSFNTNELANSSKGNSTPHFNSWNSELNSEEYQRKLEQIKQYLIYGDTYQVNFTYRLTCPFEEDPLNYFLSIDASQQSDFAMLIHLGEFIVISTSPELFFQKTNHHITCKPMKGTIERGLSFRQDEQQKQKLKFSEKQRAENVMIVDMIRNDLGKIAQVGSVKVDKLFQVETYPTLHQLTSTIQAKTNSNLVEIFQALFPCASITGAPKIRTMEIIEELENSPRGFYCGAIGLLEPFDRTRFQVAIRTVTVNTKTKSAEFGTGSGIVWDSSIKDEWQETKTKMSFLIHTPPTFHLIETMRWNASTGIVLLEEHLERLEESAFYFQFKFNKDEVIHNLQNFLQKIETKEAMLRMLLSKDGKTNITSHPIPSLKELYLLKIASKPIQSDTIFLYHKTTNRDLYNHFLNEMSNCDDVLLWNERGEITETTKFNLVMKKNDTFTTPKEECGLLNGCMRRRLLKEGKIQEGIVTLEDIRNADQIVLINSVRGWCIGKLFDG